VKVSNEFKVGLTVLIAIVSVYFGFNYLKGIDLFSNSRQFYGVYPKIDGLGVDNQVQLNGLRIGRVNKIEFMPDGSGNILVGFTIENENVRVPRNSIARIASLDLFGSKAIVLGIGTSEEDAQVNDTLASSIEGDLKAEVDRRLQPLEQKTNDLISSVDSLVTIAQTILNEDAVDDLTISFKGIRQSVMTLKSTMEHVDDLVEKDGKKLTGILDNMQSITSNLEQNNAEISSALKNVASITDSIAASDLVGTVNNAGKAMQSVTDVMNKIERGEGTLGLLINNDTLYNNLEAASLDLDLLLEDMRVNPKRYVHFSIFGKSEKNKDKPTKKDRTQ